MTMDEVISSSCPFEALANMLTNSSYTAQDLTCDSLSVLMKHLSKDGCQRQYSEEDVPNMSTLLQLVQRFAGNSPSLVLPMLKSCLLEMISEFMLATLYSLRDETSETFNRLHEEILETINCISDNSIHAKRIIIETFCDRLLQVVTSSTFKFTVKMETLKAINTLLEKCPVVVREKMRQSKTHIELMYKLGRSVIAAGDYELQVGMIEALFRLTHQKDRKDMAKVWFTDHIHFQAFQEVKDTDFETDCRRFLNLINGDVAPNTSVWSYPCQYAELGHVQLLKPFDQNYSDFWVDFNTNSRRISLFCQGLGNSEESLWETVTLWEDNIKEYVLELQDKSTKVTLFLDVDASELTTLGSEQLGNEVKFAFSAKYDIHSAIKTTLIKTQNSVKKSTVKVSSSAQSVKLNKGHTDAHVLSQDTIGSTPRRPKVSVPCVSMSTPTSYMMQEVDISPDVRPKTSTLPCKRDKPGKVQTPKTPKTPKTPNNKAKQKRVKTPLQLVTGNGSKPVVDVDDAHQLVGTNSADKHLKASKPLKSLVFIEPQEQIHDKDTFVQSSVPEEDSSVVNSQTLSQTFPALVMSRSSRSDQATEEVEMGESEKSQMDPRNMKGVAVTPCLSTITEESVPISIGLSSLRSTVYSAKRPVNGDGSRSYPTSKTPVDTTSEADESQKISDEGISTQGSETRSTLTRKDAKKSLDGSSDARKTRSRSNRMDDSESEFKSNLETTARKTRSKTSRKSKAHDAITESACVDLDTEDRQSSQLSIGSTRSTRSKSKKGTNSNHIEPAAKATESQDTAYDGSQNKNPLNDGVEHPEKYLDGQLEKSKSSSNARKSLSEKDSEEAEPSKCKINTSNQMTVDRVSEIAVVSDTSNKGKDERCSSSDQDTTTDSKTRNKKTSQSMKTRKISNNPKDQVKHCNQNSNCALHEEPIEPSYSIDPSPICIKETQLSTRGSNVISGVCHDSSDDSDVQCGQVSYADVLAVLPHVDHDDMDSQLIDSGLKTRSIKKSGCSNSPSKSCLSKNHTDVQQEKGNKPKPKFFKSYIQPKYSIQPSKADDVYAFQSDEEITLSLDNSVKTKESEACVPVEEKQELVLKKSKKRKKTSKKPAAHVLRTVKITLENRKESEVYFSDAEEHKLIPEKKVAGKKANKKKQTKTQVTVMPEPVETSKQKETEFIFSDLDEHELVTEKDTEKKHSNKNTHKAFKKGMIKDANSEFHFSHLEELKLATESKLAGSCQASNKSLVSAKMQETFDSIDSDAISEEDSNEQHEGNISPCVAADSSEGIRADSEGNTDIRHCRKKTDCGSKSKRNKETEKTCGDTAIISAHPIQRPVKGCNEENTNQASKKLDRKINALEKSLSLKFGFTSRHLEKPDLPAVCDQQDKQNADMETRPVKRNEIILAKTHPEKKSLKRKRETENPYDCNVSASEMHQAKKSRKHRSIFSETEESRSEISWLGSTCKKKQKNRKLVRTYAVKQTACVSSQLADVSAYDYNCASEEDVPLSPPKQMKPQKREQKSKDKKTKKIARQNIHVEQNKTLLHFPRHTKSTQEIAKKVKSGKSNSSNKSFNEALNLLLNQSPPVVHISPIITPKTPRRRQSNSPGEREKARYEKSPTDNCLPFDSPIQVEADDFSPSIGMAVKNILPAAELDNRAGRSGRVHNTSRQITSRQITSRQITSRQITSRRNSCTEEPVATPFRRHSMCKDDSIQVPKILFPTDDLAASQSASSEYEVCNDVQEMNSFEPESRMDSNCNAGISTLMKSFGLDVTKSLKAKKEHMESCAKIITRKANKQVKSAWIDRQRKRHKSFNLYKDTFRKELEDMEADLDNVQQVEKESMAYMKDQILKIHSFNKTSQHSLERLESLQVSLTTDVRAWKKADIRECRKVQDTLTKGIASFKNNILLDIQQQEIRNVRRTLQAMLNF